MPRCRSNDVHVAGPTDGYVRSGKHVLGGEAPRDDPGGQLAQCDITVGIRAPRDRNHGGQLGITQGGEQTTDTGDEKGEDDGGSGIVRRRVTRDDEDTPADDHGDPEQHQVAAPESSDQRARVRGRVTIGAGHGLGQWQSGQKTSSEHRERVLAGSVLRRSDGSGHPTVIARSRA